MDLRAQRWGDELPPELRRVVPSAAAWWVARPAVEQVSAALVGAGADPRLSASPVRFVARGVLDAVRPEAEVAAAAPPLAAELRSIIGTLDDTHPEADAAATADAADLRLATAEAIAELGTLLLPIARRGRSEVLRRSSPAAEELRVDAQQDAALEAALAKARADAAGWHTPLGPDDARAALAIATAKEGSFLRFLDGGWRRVKAAVGVSYTSGVRAVPVTVTAALRQLVGLYDAEDALEAHRAAAEERWGHRDLPAVAARIEAVRRPDDPAIAAWRDRLADADDDDLASVLADTRADLERLRSDLGEVLEDVDDVPLGELAATLDTLAEPRHAAVIRGAGPSLRGACRPCRGGASAPPAAGDARRARVRRVRGHPRRGRVATRPAVARFDWGPAGRARRPRAGAAARALRGRRRGHRRRGSGRGSRDDVAHAQRSVTGMTPAERERKKLWTTGRRELENEFRKVMRYRSIRDLASGETGAVVAALRPIWLMSPTSRLGHAAARPGAVRRRDLRRGEPDPASKRPCPRCIAQNRSSSSAIGCSSRRRGSSPPPRPPTTDRTTRSRWASSSTATASSPSRRAGCRRRC